MSSYGSNGLSRRLIAAQAAPVIGAIGTRRSTPFSPRISRRSPAAISSCGSRAGAWPEPRCVRISAPQRRGVSRLSARTAVWTVRPGSE
jgi:hypothetical protein